MSSKPLTEEALSRVVCPVCRGTLRTLLEAIECQGCSRRYPIIDGIPVLMAERTV